ncbi:MAG: TonB-dependent receptor [Proteobacteria bacterium]|nr:TonB-dependent receptor [Pseudomonadota bacterium]
MRLITAIFVLGVSLFTASFLMAQENNVSYFELDPVVVTGSRIPYHLSNAAQSISVVSREEIAVLPADSIADILEHVSGVDVRHRGPHGVQADVGIRGSSYEQTLILIDGVNVGDPQTGHHNMDLPVNLDDVQRIEILKGPGATIYGPNAMGGVINVITRDVDQNTLGGHITYGENGYYDMGARGALVSGKMSGQLSANRRYSSGHIQAKDTDFDIKTLNYKGTVRNGANQFHLGLGYADKDFGAYKFYSDAYPDQREKTESFLLHTGADLNFKDVKITPKIHWRHHDDEFKIKINNNWNVNKHQTDVLGIQVNTVIPSSLGDTSVGGEAAYEDLKSSNLGDRNRSRQALFFEHKFYSSDKLTFGIGASGVHYSDWGWKYLPGADLNVQLTDELNWFVSSEKSFRVPTFTDLYYFTPANQGNPDLKPEKAWTYETGMRWQANRVKTEVCLFYRDSKDIIDWSRPPGESVWSVRNVAELSAKGAEFGFNYYPASFLNTKFLSALKIAYTYLDLSRDTQGMESKYALDHLRHQVQGSIRFDWSDRVKHTVYGRYGNRIAGDEYTVVDTRITYAFFHYQFFFEANNLFNQNYIEAGFAPMPGRWVMGGVKFNL